MATICLVGVFIKSGGDQVEEGVCANCELKVVLGLCSLRRRIQRHRKKTRRRRDSCVVLTYWRWCASGGAEVGVQLEVVVRSDVNNELYVTLSP